MVRSKGFKVTTITPTVFLLAALMAVLVVVWGARPAEAAFPGSTGAIAFVKQGGFDRDIYRMNADGYGPVRISNPDNVWGEPSWSANGAQLVLTDVSNGSNNEIYLMDSDGSDPQNLTNAPNFHDSQPALSKDSSKVFYRRAPGSGGAGDIYMIDRAQPGSQPVQITNTPTFEEGQPAISPDGTKLAFASNRDGDFDIYVMKAAPESSTNVAKKLTKDRSDVPAFGFDFHPEWSPDGRQIAFTSTRTTTDWEIFRMKPAPEGRLNRPVNLTKSSSTTDGQAAWSPDGKMIAFVQTIGLNGDSEIYRMRATDGANKVNLTNDSANNDIEPSWQPIIP
jgi:Tol biopolymer transport system component